RAAGVAVEAHAVQRHRDRVGEYIRDHERKRRSARNTTTLRGHDGRGRAVRIDDVATHVLRQQAAPDVVGLVGLAVREPHLGIYEIRAATQVHRAQRNAGPGVGNRSGPLGQRRAVDLQNARITLRALRPRQTLRSLRAGVALRTLSTLRSLAI